MKSETNFNDLFDRWQAAEDVDAETLQLIKDTVGFAGETGDATLRGRASELLSSVYHLPSTPQEVALVRSALEGSGVVPPEIPPEDNGYGL